MLIGNLTRDPELRYTPSGTAVVSFGLATNRSWLPEGANERREEAEFHRIVAWNKLAELCSQLLVKGSKVYIEGRLQTRSYVGQDNTQRSITEIVIDDMILLTPKGVLSDASSSWTAKPKSPSAPQKQDKPAETEETKPESREAENETEVNEPEQENAPGEEIPF